MRLEIQSKPRGVQSGRGILQRFQSKLQVDLGPFPKRGWPPGRYFKSEIIFLPEPVLHPDFENHRFLRTVRRDWGGPGPPFLADPGCSGGLDMTNTIE